MQGLDALVILPTDPDPLVKRIKQVKDKGNVRLDRRPRAERERRHPCVTSMSPGNNPALGEVAGEYIKKNTPDAEVVVIRGLPIPIDQRARTASTRALPVPRSRFSTASSATGAATTPSR